MDIYYSTYAHINYTLRIGLCGLPYVFLELLFKIKKLLYVKQLSWHGWPFIDLLYVTLCSLALCSCIFKIIFLNIGELILNFYYLNNLASMVYIQVNLHACVWQSVFALFVFFFWFQKTLEQRQISISQLLIRTSWRINYMSHGEKLFNPDN